MTRLWSFSNSICPKSSRWKCPYLTVTGYQNTMDKVRNMLRLAQLRVYISMHSGNALRS